MYVENWKEANLCLHNITTGNHIYGLSDTGNSTFAVTTLDALSGEGMGYFVCPCENHQGQAHKGQYIYIDPIRSRIIRTIEQYYAVYGQATTLVISRTSDSTTLTIAVLTDAQYLMPTDLLTLNHKCLSAFPAYEALARQTLAKSYAGETQ